MGRYDSLRSFLAKTPEDHREVRLSFRDLDGIVGSLPPSARNHRAWWGNNQSSPQAAAWLSAGFVVDGVNLTAEHVAFARGQAASRALSVPSAVRSNDQEADRGRPPSAGSLDPDRSEATVQAQLVAYLARNGWRIHRVAETASREHGVDIIAGKADQTWAIEVKGYPSRGYSDLRRLDEVKPTSPSTQARHWYAAAMLKAVLVRDEHPDYQVAIAFPDTPTYRSLHQRSRRSLDSLAIVTFLVAVDGQVTSP